MSLVKQLWLGTAVLLLIALSGSFAISTYTAEHYLEQQLQLKNIDTATAMALSLSQMEKDPVTIELLIAAQFDTGHYDSIRLVDPNGAILVNHRFAGAQELASPDWFDDLISINVSPGVAQIQDDWQQYGTLYVESHSRFANEALWQSTRHFLWWLLIATVACGLIGTLILKLILTPLGNVIKQAESIGEQHFVTSREPKTREFKLLVQAMNKLSGKVKDMLDKKTKELELLRQHAHLDSLTQVPNREHFLRMFETSLTKEDSHSDGAICLIRVNNLAEINLNFNHDSGNKVLRAIAETLREASKDHRANYAGRLNGTDFAFISFGSKSVTATANFLSKTILTKLKKFNDDNKQLDILVAGCYFRPSEDRRKLLSLLDGTLVRAEQKGRNSIITMEEHEAGKSRNSEDWHQALTTALSTHQVSLGDFPVRTMTGEFLHAEMPVRLKLDNKWQPAGYFIGWAIKFDILQNIDLEVLKLALHKIANTHEKIAINVSEDALCSEKFRDQACELIAKQPEQARYLWLEFQESCAVRQPEEFRDFCLRLKELGCKIGLEHVGFEFSQIENLQGLGLNYLKIDSAIIRDVDSKTTNHTFLKSLCTIGHSLGMVMIAEGVQTRKEQSTLETLHLDAVTGPAIS